MFGSGLIKGLGVTIREFVETYVDDIRQIPSRYAGGRKVIDQTQHLSDQSGLFTIQYPEERRKLPERFRYIPMLIYEAETGEDRCTACGICAKVCPPQCIWIVRDRDEKGKPITRPSAFWIDASICMNCGLCAEYCPFDAIKMNHDFEISAYERMPHLVFDMQELRVPTTYYAQIRPTDFAEEEECRRLENERKAAAKAAPKPAPTAAAASDATAAPAQPAAGAAEPAAGPRKLSPEEMAQVKAEAAARRAAKAAAESGEGAPAAEAGAAPAGPRALTPEEVAQRRAEALARRAARDAAAAAPQAEAPQTATPETPAAVEPPAGPRTLTPEEVAQRRAEALARRAAKAASDEGEKKD
jgi:NADH-quinone oxidoreductase subunit I